MKNPNKMAITYTRMNLGSASNCMYGMIKKRMMAAAVKLQYAICIPKRSLEEREEVTNLSDWNTYKSIKTMVMMKIHEPRSLFMLITIV